jgi:murein DD-endopeptidase MepM/ murein hydrolase activator NlpD
MNSAQKEKSNILAINAGQVVLAQSFQVFGGTVVIDHGQGIHSLYYHLSKILVQPGQMVKKGQVLGKMGTTGVSSGVHLHLGISVYNVRVDPRQWLTGNI